MDITKEWDKLTDAEKIAYIDNNLLNINPVIDPAKEKVSENKERAKRAERELKDKLKKANDSIEG